MKKLFTIGFLFFFTLPTFSQSNQQIQTKEIVVGKNYETNKDIQAKEIIFSERIDNYYLDTISDFLTVQLRGLTRNGKYLKNSGNVILYDLAANKIKWDKEIMYQQSGIEQFDNVIIQSFNNKSYCIDNENGNSKWEIKNRINYIDPLLKIGIGYKYYFSSGSSDILEGIDLDRGKSLWKREIIRNYGWNNIFHLTDSVLLIAASGLHTINLKTGIGWDYNAVTGKNDYTSAVVGAAAGVALGILTGTFVTPTGHDVVRSIASNVLIDSADIYFASKENIVKLDFNGQVKWLTPLPKDWTSKSDIFIENGLLYMINKGFAYMGSRQLDFGTGFIAAFDLNSGKQEFLNSLGDKKNQVNDFLYQNGIVFIVYNDRVSKYSMANGTLISEKLFDTGTVGELRYFVGNQVFLKSDSAYYKSIASFDSTKFYLYTKADKILVINDDLEITTQIDRDQMYIYYLRSNANKFLSKDNETIVIDSDNRKIADLKISGNAVLIGSKLYDMHEKSFIELDLNESLPALLK